MTLLETNYVPFAPVHNIPDVDRRPQVKHLETFRMLTHRDRGDCHGDPPPGTHRRRPRRLRPAAPMLGQHTMTVSAGAGYDEAEIGDVAGREVI